MKTFVFNLFLALLSLQSFGQSIPQLEKELEASVVTQKLEVAIKLARTYQIQDKSRKAIETYEVAETLLSQATLNQKTTVYRGLSELYNRATTRKKSLQYLDLLKQTELAIREKALAEQSDKIQSIDSALTDLSEANRQQLILNEQNQQQIELLERDQLISRMMLFEDSLKLSQKNAEISEQENQTKLEKARRQKTQSIAFGIAGLLALSVLLIFSTIRSRRIISKEKKKSDELLLNILPVSIAEELKTNGKVEPQRHPDTTVMFSDFVGFSKVAEQLNQKELVELIDEYFHVFDAIIKDHKVEKIKTIGDAYMCVCGAPNPNPRHAEQVVKAAVAIQREVGRMKKMKTAANLPFFDLRIGIQSGEVIAGVVGRDKYAYDVWGKNVNLASRIESVCPPGHIAVSEATKELTSDQFIYEEQDEVDIKNTKNVKAWFHFVTTSVFEKMLPVIEKEFLDGISATCSYHSKQHTLDVIDSAVLLCKEEEIDGQSTELVKLAALFHDLGYADSPDNHEEKSVEIARQYLQDQLSDTDLKTVHNMILATQVKQQPNSKLEKIIKDADLAYLGSGKYKTFANLLRNELKAMNLFKSEDEWKEQQIGFLKKHKWYTAYAQNNWQKPKAKALKDLLSA
ncbi:adenylate/guanylate cyclase domain-containing protein [Jiulongibacter sp. NS-SX5]|uniref:adenylate/guanylate cyclase domain-containing protein n=1 Tax=Jiulongibacter sp. NS-SX5 TaxID=3463854 RepID=UPI0040597A8E